MRMVAGKVMMDRNCPEPLRDTPQSSYDDSKRLLEKWHGRGRAHYAITPRFAITSSPEQMEAAEALAREYPGRPHPDPRRREPRRGRVRARALSQHRRLHRHLRALSPARPQDAARPLHPHDPPRDRGDGRHASRSRCSVPTSNMFIGSGLFDHDRLHKHGVRIGVATDVGGGTSYSMLRTLDEGYKVLQLRGQRLTPLRSFYMMTLGNARALGMEGTIGAIAPGADADLVVLDSRATPHMATEDGCRLQLVRGTVPATDLRRRPGGGRDLCGGQGDEGGLRDCSGSCPRAGSP